MAISFGDLQTLAADALQAAADALDAAMTVLDATQSTVAHAVVVDDTAAVQSVLAEQQCNAAINQVLSNSLTVNDGAETLPDVVTACANAASAALDAKAAAETAKGDVLSAEEA